MEKRLNNKELSEKLINNYYKKFVTTRQKERERIKLAMEQDAMPKYSNFRLEDLEHLLEDHKHLFPVN